MKEVIYIHLDSISNAVMSKGLTVQDFQASLRHEPENLLLLNPDADDGEYESHTGLHIVREAQVKLFFQRTQRRDTDELKWIDFSDLHLVKQLTPIEISELLYFGHMKTHLHSPFFYKLQNNYVFLRVNEHVNKIYYRHLDDFYYILANKLCCTMTQEINSHQRGFFMKKTYEVAPIPLDILKSLKSALEDGVVFHFPDLTMENKDYHLPIYMVEDQLRKVEDIQYTKEMLVATLIYSLKTKQWSIMMEDWQN